ncbi:hypothetical protein JCM19232_350 [Vibrio ishigakensis]|uniref:Uncharacterized protein n=1 Tax=Vibrio ishigakensis TaxID=1481914 RepID=A0A0B8P657_9VIBR|nr:hypothetical protein JCM19232_350 [Vibrio ishigakensis]
MARGYEPSPIEHVIDEPSGRRGRSRASEKRKMKAKLVFIRIVVKQKDDNY